MSHYTSLTPDDLRQMLATIGVDSIEELFAAVPEGLRLRRPLDLPAGMGEQEVMAEMRRLAARNVSCDDEISFVGAGMYDHYVPAIVDTLLGRAEFLTPYTPYQPEVSQGGLQVMFEYQTAISELTGLPVSNAGLYDGPSALASAGYLAKLANARPAIVVSRGVHPHSRTTLATYAAGFGAELREVPLRDGATDPDALADALDDQVGAVMLQQPNVLGAVEHLEPLVARAREAGALAVVSCDPMTLGILRPPGEAGADIAVGEGQPLGNRLDYGGPSFGFFAARTELIRQMPGRIAGETTDADGRRGFVLTLQTREQHIRREKATSNICTAQALNALAAIVHLSWLGRRGIVELGELMMRRADYARRTLSALPGVETEHDQPIVREFALALDAPVEAVIERCAAEGVNPGYPLGKDDPEHERTLLVAITEQRTRADIDRLADVLGRAVLAVAERAVEVGVGAAR